MPGQRSGTGARRAQPVVGAAGGRCSGLAWVDRRGDRGWPVRRAGRFESEDAARRNSDRPEQGQWWRETSKLFTGEVTFRDSSDVTADVTGDPDAAGFVQVMQGRSSDPDRARQLMAQDPDEWAAFRPDVIGSVAVGHEGGAYTLAMYFTSEQAAREGERKRAAASAEGRDGGDEPAHGRRARIPRPQATLALLSLKEQGGQSSAVTGRPAL
jgi:hypothetical protein